LALPSEIMDFLWVYLVVLSLQWVLVLGFFAFNLNNILLVLSLAVWLVVLPVGRIVLGARAGSPTLWVRLPEYIISFLVFLEFLCLAEHVLLVSVRACSCLKVMFCCTSKDRSTQRLRQWVRLAHVYFFEHQLHRLLAFVVLMANLAVSLALAALDKVSCNLHTWWLLNEELARTQRREQYLENRPTLLEQEAQRHGHNSETSSFIADPSEDPQSSSSSEAPSLMHLISHYPNAGVGPAANGSAGNGWQANGNKHWGSLNAVPPGTAEGGPSARMPSPAVSAFSFKGKK